MMFREYVHSGFLYSIFDEFNQRNVNFKSEKQVNEVLMLIMDLANNTRLLENNGHTPNEIFEKYEKLNLKQFLKSLSILKEAVG